MKKALSIIFTSLSVMLILDSFNAGHVLVMFLLAGIVPGTDVALSPDTMLTGFAFLIGFTLSRIAVSIIGSIEKSDRQSSKGTMLSAQS